MIESKRSKLVGKQVLQSFEPALALARVKVVNTFFLDLFDNYLAL